MRKTTKTRTPRAPSAIDREAAELLELLADTVSDEFINAGVQALRQAAACDLDGDDAGRDRMLSVALSWARVEQMAQREQQRGPEVAEKPKADGAVVVRVVA